MKKTYLRLLFFVAAAGLFGACSDDKLMPETDYIAAQADESDDWGILDVNSGEYVCEDEFENAPSVVYNDVFVVKNNDDSYDVYNVDDVKKPINQEPYAEVTDFNGSDVALAVLPGGKINIINTDCEVVAELPADIAECYHFTLGRAVFKNYKDKYGVIDEDGNVVIEAKYDIWNSGYVYDEIATFVTVKGEMNAEDHSNWTYHAVDINGNELFSLDGKEYTSVGYFSDGKLPVVKDGKALLLDKNGEQICKLGSAEGNFDISKILSSNGKTIFYKDGKYGLKDSEGETIIRAKYESIYLTYDNEYKVVDDGEYGIIDVDGKVVISSKYSTLWGLKPNRFLVLRDSKVRLINKDGEKINKKSIANASVSIINSVTSQYIEPKAFAEKVFSDISGNSCLGYSAATTVGDLVDKGLNSGAYNYKDEYEAYISASNDKLCHLLFNGPIASSQSYYGTEFNTANSLAALVVEYNVNAYGIVEDKIASEFDKLLTSKGYKAIGSGAPTSTSRATVPSWDLATVAARSNSTVTSAKWQATPVWLAKSVQAYNITTGSPQTPSSVRPHTSVVRAPRPVLSPLLAARRNPQTWNPIGASSSRHLLMTSNNSADEALTTLSTKL